ncbi:MAG: hypothetical protein ACRDZV_07320 [Acidimicrobiia bacterium]
MRRLVAKVAGVLAVAVSALLLLAVTGGDVGLNPLNGWTILLGFVAGGLVLARSDGRYRAFAALILILGMLPALIGGVGFLYVPSLILLPFGGTHRPATEPYLA